MAKSWSRRLGRLAFLALLPLAPATAWGQYGSEAECRAAFERGGELYAKGEWEAAAVQYERALELAPRVFGTMHVNTAVTANNLGLVYWRLGRYAQSEVLFLRGLRIRESLLGANHPDVADSLNNLAILYTEMGRYERAEPLYRRSLGIYEAKLGKDDLHVATSLNELAILYAAMGRYAEAEPLYRRSLEIKEARLGKDHTDVADSLNNLAEMYRAMGRYAEAEPLYRRSLEIRQAKLGKDHPDVAFSLNNLAILYKDLGRYDEAEPLYRRSLEIKEAKLPRDHPTVADSLNNLAHLYADLGRYERAKPLYRRSLEIYETKLGNEHLHTIRALHNLANLEADRGDWAEAAAVAERARGAVRRYAQRILTGLPERDQLNFLERTDQEDFHATLSLGLARREDSALAARSAGWLLNGKAVAQETLAERGLLARDGADPQTAQLAGQLKEVRQEWARRSLAEPRPGLEKEHLRELQRLADREQELSKRLGQAAGRPARNDPWVSLDEVRQALPADAVLIEMGKFNVRNFRSTKGEKRWLGQRYAAWVIPPAGRGDVRLIDLGEAGAIDRAVQSVRTALQEAGPVLRDKGEPDAEKELHQPLEELSRRVLHPLLEHIGKSKRWVLSPDDALWLAPWAALRLPDGQYAVEGHTLRYVVSGRDLVSPAPRTTPGRPRIVADPDYDLAPAEAAAQAAELVGDRNPGELRGLLPSAQLPRRVPRLPGTAVEAAAIKESVAKYAGQAPWVYLQAQALEGVVKVFPSPRALVLSTHGYFLPAREKKEEARVLENPLLRCGLLLAGCNRRDKATGPRDEDGVLTGLEILEMDLRGTELVVLSACETGLGDVRGGEGVAGLRQAFQLAGARAVVATLWQIPDRETARLMSDFFAQLAEGQDKAEALRQAQLKLIESRRQRDGAAHPFFWAAFTLTSQGK
jgi:CHAT domain-containing protein/tetratricopeptide (TPR) repeat protein